MVEKIVNSTVESLTGVHGAIQDTEERINHEASAGGGVLIVEYYVACREGLMLNVS